MTRTTDSACANAFGCCIATDVCAAQSETEVQSVQQLTSDPHRSACGHNNNSLATSNAYKLVPVVDKNDFSFPRRVPVDLEFHNVRYTVGRISMAERKYVRKEILHGISGTFRSGQLTAIMGPSGAGKSTLLNILAGYVATGVSGNVTVNGKNRSTNSQTFRNLSAYIHQQDEHREYLTVGECMTAAAHLKLGYGVSKVYKQHVINNVLELLGLDQRYQTPSGRLSGGQKKRLSIALELINNPPVIFLDEPTTGLDSSSTTSCISLLKRLAQEGRTIVCTIHQPSALLFEMFDKLYAVAGGDCIYQGPTQLLVPFLADLGLPCPNYHNPADFLLEVAVGDYDVDLSRLINAAEKKYYAERAQHLHIGCETADATTTEAAGVGQQDVANQDGADQDVAATVAESKGQLMRLGDHIAINAHNQGGTAKLRTPSIAKVVPATATREPATLKMATANADGEVAAQQHGQSASLQMQFFLLLVRNYNCTIRNKFLIFARIFAHIFISCVFGLIYLNVGPSATAVLGNYVYLYGSTLLIVYTGKMSVLLSFPLEMEILTREHFNRWYQLGPYYLSVILFEIPFQMLTASLYVCISYYLTGNYYEMFRFNYFLLMCMMVTICAQSWGFFIGVVMPVKLAVFIGPILAVLFSVFGFCTRLVDITPLFSWMWHISYFRAGFHGVINTVYGMNRPYLICPESTPLHYCHFKNPRIFLDEMLIDEQQDLNDNIVLMGGVTIAMHVLTVMVLWLRLNKR